MNGKGVLRDNVLLGLGLVLMIAALYLIFLHVPTERDMGVVQRIFYFHVPLAWVSLLAFSLVFVFSILYLWKRAMKWDTLAHASAEVGVVFITLVLVTGTIWAKSIWGAWWTWDARLTATLVLWLTYLAYLLVRNYATEQTQGARFAAVLGIVGFVDVPIVVLAVNLWRTQHPPALIFEGGITSPMLLTIVVSIAAFTVLYILMVMQSTSIKNLQAKVNRLKHTQRQ
ncbi:MAG: cytochrome c biogenesis protein CcsA [Dehalococcoidia bacterium]|nr:cytochrome c biogenesis protein CcsA [Dehalococcoidia bacterium]